jgi:hypothetical protein
MDRREFLKAGALNIGIGSGRMYDHQRQCSEPANRISLHLLFSLGHFGLHEKEECAWRALQTEPVNRAEQPYQSRDQLQEESLYGCSTTLAPFART